MNSVKQRSHKHVLIPLAVALAAVAVILALRALDIIGPPHIILTRGPYLQDTRQDRITLCWETDEPAKATVQVTEENDTAVATLRTPSAARRHELSIGGLEPGHKYRYQLASARTVAGTREGSFSTAPTMGKPLDFVVWGDSRSHSDICEAIAGGILASGVPMCVHTGDFVSSGVNLPDWNFMFFEPCRDLLRSVVLWPAIGNHEMGHTPNGLDGRTVFTQVFALPGKEHYYSFDWGDAHFLVLDSNLDFYDNPEQVAFAEQDLAAAKARWLFAVWHHPAYNVGRHHGNHIGMRTLYCPLMARHNVDVIFTGHEHNYQFSKPIRHEEEPLQTHPYWHLVVGGGGAPLYGAENHDIWLDKAAKVNHFVLIHIEGDVLTGQAIDIDGKVFHRFTIDKAQPPADVVSFQAIEMERCFREQFAPDEVYDETAR